MTEIQILELLVSMKGKTMAKRFLQAYGADYGDTGETSIEIENVTLALTKEVYRVGGSGQYSLYAFKDGSCVEFLELGGEPRYRVTTLEKGFKNVRKSLRNVFSQLNDELQGMPAAYVTPVHKMTMADRHRIANGQKPRWSKTG